MADEGKEPNPGKEPEFFIELDPGIYGVALQSQDDRFSRATRETLDKVVEVVRESCSAFVEELGGLETKPSELMLEFGVSVGGEAGVPFVTKGSITANFKVALTWKWP